MRLIVVVAGALMTSSLLAQNPADPDKNVVGGVLVKGWMGRTDKASQQISNAKFAEMGKGFHVTSGPPAIYWNPAHSLSGTYTVSAKFSQTKAPAHPEAYGLFVGGSNLDSDNITYFYCIVRGDGKAMVKHRATAKNEDVHTVMDWKEFPQVAKQDEAGKATNDIAWTVSPEKAACLVNGKEVFALPKPEFAAGKTVAGIRVNHNLDVHIADFTAK